MDVLSSGAVDLEFCDNQIVYTGNPSENPHKTHAGQFKKTFSGLLIT